MSFFEALIVYLSIGAPFGVIALLSRRGRPLGFIAVAVFFNVVLWPAIAAIRIWQALSGSARLETNEAEAIFAEIDGLLSDKKLPRSAPLRRAVERYVFLTAALENYSKYSRAGELSEIAGHPNPNLAAVCLARKEREKLKHHQIAAADDLLFELDQIPAGLLSEISEAIERTCESLGDSNAAIRVSELSFERTIDRSFVLGAGSSELEAGIRKAA